MSTTFVDNNGIVAFQDCIEEALHQTLESAFELFDQDRQQSCMNADKWYNYVSHIMTYLGFEINTRCMLMTWPQEKRLRLVADIDSVLNT